MRCWHCNSRLNWNSDFDLEDITGEVGIVTFLTCMNDECGASYECILETENPIRFLAINTPKKLPRELSEQLNWAKETLVGKTFENKKTHVVYYVKSITVDSETMGLRVVYVDGVSDNEWDRPLSLFIQEFTEYTGGREYEE